MLDGTYFFECYCYHSEHTVKFVLDKGYYELDTGEESERKEPRLSIYVFLSTRGFFHRLWKGIKYIFGYKCRYGHFGNWTLHEDDLEKLENMVKDYKDVLEEWKLKNPQLYNKKA